MNERPAVKLTRPRRQQATESMADKSAPASLGAPGSGQRLASTTIVNSIEFLSQTPADPAAQSFFSHAEKQKRRAHG